MRHIFFILCLLTFSLKELFCQELPAIIPPSPEASSLFKYLDYPVSNSTGIPDISIPIFVVKSGELSVPISINYHASGRKVFDQDGTVALGWTLSAGGLISRTVYGDPDFGTYADSPYSFPNPFLLEDDIHIQEDFEYLAGIENYEKFRTYGPGVDHWRDSEYDIFSYSLGQSSGHLVFKDVNGVKTPFFIPMKPYLLEKDGEPLNYIIITDDRGNSYKFSDKEMRGGLITSWALTQIVSANKKDIIEFKYANFTQKRTSYTGEYRLIDDWRISGIQPFSDDWDGLIPNKSSYSVRRLSEIDFKKGKVIFNHYTDGEYEGMINEIQILDQYGVTVKRVKFEQTLMNRFTEGVTAAHKLDKLTLIGKNGENEEIYTFDYYPTVLNNSGLVDVRAQDYWGYYNADMTPSLIPYYENIDFIYQGNTTYRSIGQIQDRDNRLPNHEATKSGVLRKVTYPTGGEAEFIYGQNKYFDQSSSEIMDYGGLRINQIITTDGAGNTYYKTYDYGDFGYVSLEPKVECLSYENRYVYFNVGGFTPSWGGSYRERVFTSSFLPDLEYLASQPIIYPQVIEYHGTETLNTGKTIYKYDYRLVIPRPLQTQHSSVGDIPGINMIRFHVGEYNLWDNPMLEYKLDYKRTDQVDNPYQLVKSYVNHYSKEEEQSITGLHMVRTYIFPQDGTAVEPNMYADKYAAEFYSSPPNIYGVSNYSIPVGWKRIEYTSETDHFADGSSIGRTINYTYNDKLLLSETNTTRSDGKSIITLNQYPFEYSGNAVLTNMVSKNMLDYVVEQKEFLENTGTTPLKSMKTVYSNWGNDVIAPVRIETSTGSDPYKPRLNYTYNNSTGNVESVSKDGGSIFTYLWSYANQYPVAKIENASYTEVENAVSNISSSFIASLGQSISQSYIDSKLVQLRTEIVNDLPNAMITTYTYDPLVGMISQTDPNGIISYYEYDDMSRLKLVKDEDGNIVQHQQYHYKEQ